MQEDVIPLKEGKMKAYYSFSLVLEENNKKRLTINPTVTP